MQEWCSWLHGTAETPLTSTACSLSLPVGQIGGVFSLMCLLEPGKSHTENIVRRASREGVDFGMIEGSGNLAQFLVYMVPDLVKCLYIAE